MLRVGFDAAALVLNRAGEYRYASALPTGAARARDVELHELWPGRRVPGPPAGADRAAGRRAGRLVPFAIPRRRAARLDVLHHPRYAVSPEPGLGMPVVVTMHDVLVLSAPELFSAPIRANFRALAGPLARRAAVVLTGSQASARDIAEHLRVPGGADRRDAVRRRGALPARAGRDPELLARLGIDGPYVACVGTLEPRKNLVTALRAFARHRRGRDARGRRRARLAQRGVRGGARGVRGRVVLTGFLSDEDLVGVLAGARCFLYPSLHEGYGFPPLEAMACGTPVVTSATSSLPEVVGDAGLLVDPGDAEAVAGAVERLLRDDAPARVAAPEGAGRASSYTWERCAAATVAAYRRAAA